MSTVDAVMDKVGPRPNAFVRLYRGETSFDFVGRRRWWYGLSALVILAGLASFAVKGFNWGIEFKGGTAWVVPAHGHSVSDVERALSNIGLTGETVQTLGRGSSATVQVQADLHNLSPARQAVLKNDVQRVLGEIGHTPAAKVTITDVGPTWGRQISQKAIIAVLVFFVVVVAYISLRFEWKMAIAALIAVIHDLLVVAGVYSLAGFQVEPSTVIAVLTILGYSLYDTVVVFDRVKENTRGLGASGRMTYEDVVNLSMNQTLARSINTSLVAILPVLAVLVIGAQLLGATTLQYFGLALVIGLTSGAYSSIFIASPVLASMKEREPRYANIRQKLANRADQTGILTPRAAAALALAGGGSAGRAPARSDATTGRRQGGVLKPGAARLRDGAGNGAGGLDGSGAETAGASLGGRADPARPPGSGTPGGARRPPPRPRKGKGAKKGGRRR